MAISAMQAAKAACQLSGWSLSNLELHKLLYIAHMLYLGSSNGEPLIYDEDFQAWDYGPVLPSVYRHCSAFGSSQIKNVFHHIPLSDDTNREIGFIRSVLNQFGGLGPYALVELTHEDDSAWAHTYVPGYRNLSISQSEILNEYQRRFTSAR
ncbi:Panacea domain-containing protein [Vreelandella sp. EE27]